MSQNIKALKQRSAIKPRDQNEVFDLFQGVKKLEENRDTILHFGVSQIGMFGSYARGKQTQASDLDFLVEFDNPTDEFLSDVGGHNE